MTRKFTEDVTDVRIFVKNSEDKWYETVIPTEFKSELLGKTDNIDVLVAPVNLNSISNEDSSN